MKICENCKKEFSSNITSRKIFCSKECFLEKYPNSLKLCLGCGREFYVHYHQSYLKYCCKKCSIAKKESICPCCKSNFFHGMKENKKFCSNSCSNKYNGRRSKIDRGELPFRRSKNKISLFPQKKESNLSKKSLSSKILKNNVFTKEWFVEKYGESDGNKMYTDRCNKIKETTYFKIINKQNKNNYSKISQKLFWDIYDKIKNKYKKIYFHELNHEFGCSTSTNFDFVIVDNKRVIEFNGDKFHANPMIYNHYEKPNPFNSNITASDIWLIDKDKNDKAIKNGYKIFIVWENEYLKNKSVVLENCLKFLEGE